MVHVELHKAYRDTESKTEREEDGHGQSKSDLDHRYFLTSVHQGGKKKNVVFPFTQPTDLNSGYPNKNVEFPATYVTATLSIPALFSSSRQRF